MEQKFKEKTCWPIFLVGLALGLFAVALYFLRTLISGTWFGGLGLFFAIATVGYILSARRLRFLAWEKTGRWKKISFGVLIVIVIFWQLIKASLGSTGAFRYIEDALMSSGWIWIVLGIAIMISSWPLSRRPADPPAAPSKDAPPPWEG